MVCKLPLSPIVETNEVLKPRAAKVKALEFQALSDAQSEEDESCDDDDNHYKPDLELDEVNRAFKSIDGTLKPINLRILANVDNLSDETFKKMKGMFDSIMESTSFYLCEAIATRQAEKLKQKFNEHSVQYLVPPEFITAYENSPNNRRKLFILSLFSSTLKQSEFQEVFSCSSYMIAKSRNICKQKNNLKSPNQKRLQEID